MVCSSTGCSGGGISRTPHALETSCSASHQEGSQGPGVALSICLEVIKQLVQKAGFSKMVAEVVALDLEESTACLYPGTSIGVADVILLHARPLFCR